MCAIPVRTGLEIDIFNISKNKIFNRQRCFDLNSTHIDVKFFYSERSENDTQAFTIVGVESLLFSFCPITMDVRVITLKT